MKRLLLSVLLALGLALPAPAHGERLLDVVDVVGARDNQLVGYGIVTGLNGTGDDASAPYAAQSLRALLRRLGVQVDSKQVRLRNVAAVVVTATLPAFARSGSRLDVTVSSMGNAKSLRGGVLLAAPLRGGNRKVYSVAQGPLIVGGFSASGASGSSVSENVTTTARIPGGGLVERSVRPALGKGGVLELSLRAPSFVTARRVAVALEGELGKGSATATDAGTVRVKVPEAQRGDPVALVARIAELDVQPEVAARVVINERTGTIVAGGDVRLSPVAIAQGGITIRVTEEKKVSQPPPLTPGARTVVVPDSKVEAEEPAPALHYVDGAASLAAVAEALGVLGVSPRDLASILQALKAAGALRAEVIVQ